MIGVTVRVGAGINSLKRVEQRKYNLPDNITLSGLMQKLYICFGEEILKPTVLVAVNGVAVRNHDHWVLKDADIVSVIKANVGG